MSGPADQGDKDPEAERSQRRGIVVRAVVAALGLALVAAVLVDWNAIRFEGSRAGTNDAQLQGNPVRIEARVAGFVTRVGTDDDQPVQRGQLLYEIEQDIDRAQVAQNQAALRQADAQAAELQARIEVQRAAVASAAATAEAAAADLLRSQRELSRQNALRGTEGEVIRDWQQASADARRDAAMFAADQDAARAAAAQVAILQAQLAQAQSAAAAQRARLDLAKINFGYTTVSAPGDGVVTARLAFTGQYVVPGQPLITFVPLDDIWAVANFREEQLATMRAGQPAELHVDAFPDVSLYGKVDSIGPLAQARQGALAPDRATGNFTKVVQRIPVKITLDPGWPLQGLLLPGLSVEARVSTGGAP